MAIITIESPMYDSKNPKCRACQWYGKEGGCGPNDEFRGSEKCVNPHAKIRKRTRDHNDKACLEFRLAEWLRNKE